MVIEYIRYEVAGNRRSGFEAACAVRVVFALHRCKDDPNEFWIYETRKSEKP